LETQR